MKRDLTAWALVVAGLALPLAAHAAGFSFIVRDVDGGPYFLFSPLWFLIGATGTGLAAWTTKK